MQRTIGEQIAIKTITWNMGDTHPPQNLRDMVEDKQVLDIIVIAVQESKFQIFLKHSVQNLSFLLVELLNQLI